MATKTTGWLCTHSASVVTNSADSAVIRVYCNWKNNGWTYDINYVSAWVTCNGVTKQVKSSGSISATSSTTQSVSCGYADFTITKTKAIQNISCYAKITSSSSYVSGTKSSAAATVPVSAKTSYSVKYGANGGSSTPDTQTKWYGEDITLASAISKTGHTFYRWNTNASGTGTKYTAGGKYTANANVTLYATWTANKYTIKFDANGGSGAPSAQTKTYGVDLTLSSTKPTRTNYNFLGWATSASATSATYAAGDTYSTNSAVTLYAVWQLAYTKPRITSVSVYRCDSSGTASDSGTYFKATFKWASDKTVSSITVAYTPSGGSTTTRTMSSTYATGTYTGTSGTVTTIVSKFSGIDIDKTYSVVITVADASGSTSVTKTLASRKFYIDTAYDTSDGTIGVSIGKAVEKLGHFDIGLNSVIHPAGYSYLNASYPDNAAIGIASVPTTASYFPIMAGETTSGHRWSFGAIGDQITFNGYYSSRTANGRDWWTGWYVNSGTFFHTKNMSISGVFIGGNYDNMLGNMRFGGEEGTSSVTATDGASWIGFYNTKADAQNNNNRHGYFGFGALSNNHVYLVNEVPATHAYLVFRVKNSDGSNCGLKLQQTLGTAYNGHFCPETDNKTTLGTTANRWQQLYAGTTTIYTSDAREKHDIAPLSDNADKLEALFNSLTPKVYRMNNGRQTLCMGFVAQDIAAVLNELGFDENYLNVLSHDKWTDSETNEEKDLYSLAYNDFIALTVHMVQKQQAKIESQQKEIDDLKSRIEKLEALLLKEE